MRGMINGVWHAKIHKERAEQYAKLSNFPISLSEGDEIDIDRLAHNPSSFHLYAAPACPFAHRTLLARALLDIDLPVTLINPWLGGPDGWFFPPDQTAPVAQATKLWQVYAASDPSYTGRVTVPALWDKKANAIVSVESDEITQSFLKAYAGKMDRPDIAASRQDPELASLCDWIKEHINDGVYRIGFAQDQFSYDQAYGDLERALASLDARLGDNTYLWNNTFSEADLLLFPTAVRFDVAYHGAFQILGFRWKDFGNLQRHLETLLDDPLIAATVSAADYRVHYFDDDAFSIRHPGPNGRYIVPHTCEL